MKESFAFSDLKLLSLISSSSSSSKMLSLGRLGGSLRGELNRVCGK